MGGQGGAGWWQLSAHRDCGQEGVQGYLGAQVEVCRDAGMHGYTDKWMHRYTDKWMHRYMEV